MKAFELNTRFNSEEKTVSEMLMMETRSKVINPWLFLYLITMQPGKKGRESMLALDLADSDLLHVRSDTDRTRNVPV